MWLPYRALVALTILFAGHLLLTFVRPGGICHVVPIAPNPSIEILNKTRCSDSPLSIAMLNPPLCNTTKEANEPQECIDIRPCPTNTTLLSTDFGECQYSCAIKTRRMYTMPTKTVCYWLEVYLPEQELLEIDSVWFDQMPSVISGYYTLQNMYKDRDTLRLKAFFDPLMVTTPTWWIAAGILILVAFWTGCL